MRLGKTDMEKINVKSAKFVKSVATFNQIKDLEQRPHIAFVGRSNAGKSSLLNMLCNQKGLAVVSSTPGRTRLINIFDVVLPKGRFVYFVDLPGYGFAKAGKNVKDGWNENIGDYLLKTRDLKLVCVLLDIRHKPSELDVSMLNFLQSRDVPFSIVLTKSDKLSRAQASVAVQNLVREIGVAKDDVIVTSSSDKKGKEELFERIDNVQ